MSRYLLKALTTNIPIGHWFGVPVSLHSTWILLLLLLLYLSPSFAAVWVTMFGIVLMHEFGHIFAGRFLGCKCQEVVLYPIGGAAMMMLPKDPVKEFLIALAGPLVNLALVPILIPFMDQGPYLRNVAICNIGLLVFNLIPALPMDGGRIFRSVLSLLLRNHLLATIIAARVGQVFCILFVLLGMYTLNFGLLALAFFIFLAAEGEIENARPDSSPPKVEISQGDVQQSAQMLAELEQRIVAFEQRKNSS